MVTYVLDYSSGFPHPSDITGDGYVGTVRYVGTPGRTKNLTIDEYQLMSAAGIPISLVYEDSAGWMQGGAKAGAKAAQAALDNALATGLPVVRCVYFACDVDITTQEGMDQVADCLDGAATILGRKRVGIYGEADVIDAMIPAHATYGWQTRAWSEGRLSNKAHIYQQIGYVYPGGVQCDRSTVLQDDWGQVPFSGGLVMDVDVQAAFDELKQLMLGAIGATHHDAGQIISGDPAHKDSVKQLRTEVAQLNNKMDEFAHEQPETLRAALADAVVKVNVEVVQQAGSTTAPEAPSV